LATTRPIDRVSLVLGVKAPIPPWIDQGYAAFRMWFGTPFAPTRVMRYVWKHFAVRYVTFFFAAVVVAQIPSPPSNPATATPAKDKLGRDNPRDTVTGFLEACHKDNYILAAQYLELRDLPAKNRQEKGPQLARKLETVLNSAAHFSLSDLPQDPEGN